MKHKYFHYVPKCEKLVGDTTFLLLFSQSADQIRQELVKIIEQVFSSLPCVIGHLILIILNIRVQLSIEFKFYFIRLFKLLYP